MVSLCCVKVAQTSCRVFDEKRNAKGWHCEVISRSTISNAPLAHSLFPHTLRRFLFRRSGLSVRS